MARRRWSTGAITAAISGVKARCPSKSLIKSPGGSLYPLHCQTLPRRCVQNKYTVSVPKKSMIASTRVSWGSRRHRSATRTSGNLRIVIECDTRLGPSGSYLEADRRKMPAEGKAERERRQRRQNMEKSGWVVTGWWSGEDFFQRRRGPHAQRSIGHTNADLLPRALPIKAQIRSMSIRLTACTSLFDRLPTCAARTRVALRRG